MKSALQFGFLLVFLSFQVGKGFDNFKEVNYKEFRLDNEDQSCPDGFYFNETIEICISTDIYNCSNYQIAKCPISTDVAEYCLCQNKYLQIWKCPDGTYFDSNRLICRIGTVECQEEYMPFTCPDNSVKNTFCLCIDGKLHQNYCPTGSTFKTEQKLCLKTGTEDDDIPDSEPSSVKCQRYGLFGDPSDCAGYYHCQDKGSDIQYSKCSGGTIFSLTSFGCVAGTC
ncbi:hypothetical protein KR084_010050 [Drosophila pseudotakahashii]|nr:hypothetical protein KR084_010050 [Drosophila pseudotakahashii]